MNKFDEMRQALNEAKNLQAAADSQAKEMARILKGRLRRVGADYWGHEILCELKRELADYNMRTGEWK